MQPHETRQPDGLSSAGQSLLHQTLLTPLYTSGEGPCRIFQDSILPDFDFIFSPWISWVFYYLLGRIFSLETDKQHKTSAFTHWAISATFYVGSKYWIRVPMGVRQTFYGISYLPPPPNTFPKCSTVIIIASSSSWFSNDFLAKRDEIAWWLLLESACHPLPC